MMGDPVVVDVRPLLDVPRPNYGERARWWYAILSCGCSYTTRDLVGPAHRESIYCSLHS